MGQRPSSSLLDPVQDTTEPQTGLRAPTGGRAYSSLLDPPESDPLAQALASPGQVPAERALRVSQLSLQFRVPAAVVDSHLEEFERLSKVGTVNVDELRRQAPALAHWLSQDARRAAATTAEELTRLRALERHFQWSDPLLRSIDNMQGSVYGTVETLGEATGLSSAIQWGRQGRERNRLEAMAYGRGPELATAFDSPQDTSRYVYELVGEQVPVLAVNMAGMATGATIGAGIGSVVPGIGTAVGGTVGGVIGAFVPSWVLGVGETQGTLKELNPDAVAPTWVLLGGTAIGALDTALPGHLGSKLVKTLGRETAEKAARRLLLTPVKPKFWTQTGKGVVTGMSTEGVTEGFQEVIGGVAAAMGADRRVDWSQLSQQALEAAVAGALVGGVFEGGFDAATFKREEARWIAAKQQEEFFRTLGKGVVDSELLAKLPEGARQWITEAVKDGPIDQVYIPIKQFEEYWQQQGESPDVMADAITGEKGALEQAKLDKTGLLPVKTADYATKIAGSAHGDFFYKEVKLRPDVANVREVDERVARIKASVEARRAQVQEEQRDALGVITQGLVQMWVERGASRYQAQKWAAIYGPRYVERARRKGEDPLKTFANDPRVVFYSLANGAPLVPTAPPPPGQVAPGEAPTAAAQTPDAMAALAAIPDTAMTEAREQTLDAAFRTITAPPTDTEASLALEAHGFSLAEVQAFEAAGLATAGRMTRQQFADYLEARLFRMQAAQAAAAQTMPDLPASVAPPGESGADRTRRRGLQLAALTSLLTREAQRLDPSITPERIRQELERRLEYLDEQAAAIQESGRGQALLRAIVSYGGIWYNERTGGERDEVLRYANQERDPKTRRERGGRSAEQYDVREWDTIRTGEPVRGIVPTWNGVAGVFQKGGKTPDHMATLLRQDGSFANLAGPNELFEAIDAALRARPEVDQVPGTRELARLGVDPQTQWWLQPWGLDPAIVAEDADFGLESDLDFDPADFEQRTKRGFLPHGAWVMETEVSTEVYLPGGARMVLHTQEGFDKLGPPGYLYVGQVYVPENQRRQGVGRRLYEAAVGVALSKGLKGLASRPYLRNEQSDAMWRALARDGVVRRDVQGYDIVTYTGGEFFQRRRERRALPRVLRERAETPVPRTVDKKLGFEGVSAAVEKSKTPMLRLDLKQFIQALADKAIKAAGLPDGPLDTNQPEVQDYLVRILTEEALAALRDHPEAIGWYDTKVPQARELVGLIHPEVMTDDNAWFVFTYALAVLSNGTPVDDNFAAATFAYEQFKQTGELPTDLGRGKPAANVNAALATFNREVNTRGGVAGGGLHSFRAFLMQRVMATELKAQGFKHVAALADEEVFGALIIGPKIGNGFFLNLQGVLTQFTMDRWWSRTWGRLTGSLILSKPELVVKNRGELREAMAALKVREVELLESIVGPLRGRYSNEQLDAFAALVSKKAADTDSGLLAPLSEGGIDQVRLKANTLTDNLLKERETPLNNGERAIMKRVALRALANVQAAGYPTLTPADFQAVVWYPEKRLYETAAQGQGVTSYDEDAAPDYANAAAKFARDNGAADSDIADALARGHATAARRAAALQPRLPAGLPPTPAPAGLGAVAAEQLGDEFFQQDGAASATLDGFYSRLALPVRTAKVDAAKGRDWKAIIKAARTGISLDEYQAVGVQFLEDGTTYTRAEVLAFLKQHEVQLEVVELADPHELVDPELLVREADRVYQVLIQGAIETRLTEGRGPDLYTEGDLEVRGEPGLFEEVYHVFAGGRRISINRSYATEAEAKNFGLAWIEQQNDRIQGRWEAQIADTVPYAEAEAIARENLGEAYQQRQAEYSTYVLPHGVEGSYREVFITAPNAGQGTRHIEQRKVIEAALAAVRERLAGETPEFADEPNGITILEELLESGDFRTLPNGDFFELTDQENQVLDGSVPGLGQDVARVGNENPEGNWSDGHAGYGHVKNPVVRLRYNAREVEVTVPESTLPDGRTVPRHIRREKVLFLEEVQPPSNDRGNNQFAKMPELFQKHWRDLAMRFALQHAATHGYRRVAWTPGQVQVDRYGLRQQAKLLIYHPTEGKFIAYGEHSVVLMERSGVTERHLRTWLGDEDATRLLAQTPERNIHGNPRYVLSNEVTAMLGGEGLLTLYDQQLGRSASNLPAMRRHGVKVTTMELPNMRERWVYTGPRLTAAELEALAAADVTDLKPGVVGVPGGPLGAILAGQAVNVADTMKAGQSFDQAMGERGSQALAIYLAGRLEQVSEPLTVPGYSLTPRLRSGLLVEGQEFFQPGERRPPLNQNAPYQQSMFGEPLPPVDPFAPVLPTRVEMVTQGQRTLNSAWVFSPDDAAAAMAYLAKGAQERFDGLVVDADGTPLAIIGGFKGAVDRASVEVSVLLAEALSVPGAASLWLAHNHPSGAPNLSDADRGSLADIARAFQDTGIEVEGLLAIGAGMGPARQWSFTRPGYDQSMDRFGEARLADPSSTATVPVQEREFVRVDRFDDRPITTPALAAAVVPAVAKGRFGVVFTDNKLRAIGFAPLDPATALELKEQGRAKQLYQTWAQSGAHSAFVFTPDLQYAHQALNVAQALHAIGVGVLDLVDPAGTAGMPRNILTGDFTQPLERGGGEGPILPEGVRGSFNRLHGWIRLIAGAENLSTFLHESGHAFLHELMTDSLELSLRDPATLNPLQEGLIRDAHVVLRWFGFEGTIGDFLALSTDQQRQMHEQWARSFEVYLMTGQAPSAELRPIFATFRAWLTTAYQYLLTLGGAQVDQATAEAVISKEAGFQVTLPQEIRDVMDRLLASDEAIAAVKAEGEVVPLFSDQATAGVNDLTWAAYLKTITDAHLAGREQLTAKVLGEWRRAQQAEWQREREAVREQVVTELNTNPVVVALSVMRTGKLPDGSIPSFSGGQPMKLSKDAIVQMKGEPFLRRLPRPYVYTRTGGLSPDVLAPLIGFSSGEQMLDELVNARSPRLAIEAETDRRMREKHGDSLLEGLELKDLAEQALYDHRSEIISAELKALTQGMVAAAVPSAASLRTAAEARIARYPVQELKPGLFLQAATRASQRAFDAFGRNDRAAAVQHKIDELTSLALYRAAANAKERSERSGRLLGEYQTSPGRRKTLLKAGTDYLDQVDALLERYEFTRTTLRAQERRVSLRKWIETQQANGLPVEIADWLIDDSRVINYRQLTVEELETLRGAVEHIAHLARLKTKLLDARHKKELEEIRQEMSASILAHNKKRARVLEPRIGYQKNKKSVVGFLYDHRKIASISRQLDGFVDGGAMWTYVDKPLNEAANRENSMNAAAVLALTQLFERFYTPGERAQFNRKRPRRELDVLGEVPTSESKQGLLMMALNQGNDANRQRLRDGYGWTQEQVQQALDAHLDKRDWDFVQAVWDYLETYWPLIAEKQQRVVGAIPEKVQATPVFTRFGEYRGGYFPIAFDSEQSGKQASLELGTMADLAKAAAYVHATTARGHVERRADGPVRERPVRLDFGVIHQHLGQVIHDLTHHEVLIDVGRILDSDHAVAKSIIATAGPQAFEQYRTALRDIALGDVPARHHGEGLAGYLRTGQTVVGLAWNVMTSAIQWVGYTQSIKRIGWAWAGRGLMSYLRGALPMQQGTKAILAESEFMRNRFAQHSVELHDLNSRLGIHSGVFAGWIDAGLRTTTHNLLTKQAIADSFLWMIGKAQQMVDVPTYLGAKAKAAADPANLREDGTLDEERVIRLAEQAVIDAQGAGRMKDLAAVQKGPPSWKLWINFYSFFNVTYNLWAESVLEHGGKLRVNPANPFAVGRLAADYILLFAAPTILVHLTRSVLQDTLGDELEEPEALAWALVRENLAYMAGSMVFFRELGGYLEGMGRYEGPAGARGIPSIGKFLAQVQQMEWDEALARSFNQAAGVLFYYPAGQVDRTVRGFQALMNGQTENPLALIFGPPPKNR